MELACAYTALFGGYERLLEQPTAGDSALPHICFTDDPSLTSDTWEIRVVAPVLPLDAVRSSREPKLLAHRHLSGFDVSLYLDNSVELFRPAEEIIEAWLGPDDLAAFPGHSFRETVRAEFEEVLLIGLDSRFRLEEQLHDYQEGTAASLDRRPLWNGMIARRHHHPHVVAAMERWWAHVLRYSRRDQLSAWPAFDEVGFVPRVVEIDNHESPLHRWPVDVGRGADAGQQGFREPEERWEAAVAAEAELRQALERERASAASLATARDAAREALEAMTVDRDRLADAVRWWNDAHDDLARRLEHAEAERDHLRARDAWLTETNEHLTAVVAHEQARRAEIEQSRTWRLLRRVRSWGRRTRPGA